ncbi:MAG: glycine cleavage system aminomethyltransferase GcvT [Chloroflexi bacterium]|nr:glycine cleavage system aminomethyltransferase GcvT [Chloroflexota bacterium]MBU1746383.1 glycine cleavage system aminomethyltransferase GcvT [Chloroflexota bacterium]
MRANDFLFRGSLADLDPAVAELIGYEAERQARKLILIPSESSPPEAVREAQGSVFQNIYAEGYPHPATREQTEAEILDYERQLTDYRRYSDARYYKGTEYANLVEALARRRCAEVFATPDVYPEDIYVNVQPLSGAPANNAVYTALLKPGQTVMGMSLLHGGHLTHGSPANRSGKLYHAVSYSVDPDTERLDYNQIAALAREHQPHMIIAGYTSYPWAADWARFRAIADEVGAFLLADISHVAGMVAAGVYPSPVGHAHVITFTTHKTMLGPRGACILATDARLAARLDRAVFPGEQGGPHVNTIAAMTTAFRLAQTEQFRALQRQIVVNAARLAQKLAELGFRIPYGGTDTHLLLVDCKSVRAADGTPLLGDMAARILDLAGIVCNRNTIPGDETAGLPSGIRLGTPWVTQRGLKEPEIDRLAEAIALVLQNCWPFTQAGRFRPQYRARVGFDVLEDAERRVTALADAAGLDYEPRHCGYPHYDLIILDKVDETDTTPATLEIEGELAREFLQTATTNDVYCLQPGDIQPTCVLETDGRLMASGTLACDQTGHRYRLTIPAHTRNRTATWLRDLSDGFVLADPADPHIKLPGPVIVRDLGPAPGVALDPHQPALSAAKPAYIGLDGVADAPQGEALPEFAWRVTDTGPVQRTPLYDWHQAHGAHMVEFAGWDMPVRYAGVQEEHRAVRTAAGLFDVCHMGIFDFRGPNARAFLDLVSTNDVSSLEVGQSQYSYLLSPHAHVIDDVMVYRLADERYMMVVNASNNNKDWAWLHAVNQGAVRIDMVRPWTRLTCPTEIRDLRDPASGADRRVNIALQGPESRRILRELHRQMGGDRETWRLFRRMARTDVVHCHLGPFDLIVARTGYTGERRAYELFVHPDQALALWEALLAAGEPFGLKPIGLAARDSLRIEAGLPLYGHELAGPLDLGPGDAGFADYVKVYKPFFVGRRRYMADEQKRAGVVARFRMVERGVRVPQQGDPVLSLNGRVVGKVTSCSTDGEGRLVGQVYIKQDQAAPGTPLAVFQTARVWASKPRDQLTIGDRVQLHDRAEIVSRFM